MKKSLTKVLAVLLALAMALCMTACGNSGETTDEPETITSIEIGGDFDPIDLNDKALGEYTKIDTPDWFTVLEGDTAEMYYCEGSDTPYIAVVDHPIDTDFEEAVENISKTWGDGYYQMISEDIGYIAQYLKLDDGTMYYIDTPIYNFGDSVKQVIFYGLTEEVQIADSDLYFNIMTGYENKLSEEDEAFKASVYAEYDDSYYFPNVYACEDFETLEMEKKYFSFLKEFNLNEEDYNRWSENWSEQDEREYLEALGFEVRYQTEEIKDDFSVYAYACSTDNSAESVYNTFLYIERNGKWYLIDTWTMIDNPHPAYITAMIESIHVK